MQIVVAPDGKLWLEILSGLYRNPDGGGAHCKAAL
jgi:hypothetical protein